MPRRRALVETFLPSAVLYVMSLQSAVLIQLFPICYGARSWVSLMQYSLSISHLLPLFVTRLYLESFSVFGVVFYDLLVGSSGDKAHLFLHTCANYLPR